MSGVAKRQENVHLEGVSDVDAPLSPIRTLEDRRKTLKELSMKAAACKEE